MLHIIVVEQECLHGAHPTKRVRIYWTDVVIDEIDFSQVVQKHMVETTWAEVLEIVMAECEYLGAIIDSWRYLEE